mgnify:CR=1 FL=1
MVYTCRYKSPLGEILLAADEIGLTGLWFEGEKYFADNLPEEHKSQETQVLSETKHWLDIYFTGMEPDFMLQESILPMKSMWPGIWNIIKVFRNAS